MFDRTLKGREAAREMIRLKQGVHSVYNYAIEFRTLSAACDWNEHALFDAFFNGLSDFVKDELIVRELPNDLSALVETAGRIDTRHRSRLRERALRQPVIRTPPLRDADPTSESMQVDQACVSPEERQRRRQTGACYYCGQSGHLCQSCPLRGGTSSVNTPR